MELPKGGIIFDSRMLEHKSSKKHPENEQRVKAIMMILQERQILNHPKIDYIQSVAKRPNIQDQLLLAHNKKCINLCKSLSMKSAKGTEITVSETYFNEKTQDVARIAVSCQLEGIDKINTQKWRSGFVLKRPTGHHAGAKDKINGFCIYNNVCIGANCILKNNQKLSQYI